MKCEKCNNSVKPGEYCDECGYLNQQEPIEVKISSENETCETYKNEFIDVAFDSNVKLFSNQLSNFPYRLTVKKAGIQNIETAFSLTGNFKDDDVFRTLWNSSVNQSRIFHNINIAPEKPGVLGFIFFISFMIDGERHAYEGELQLRVYPDPGKSNNLKINIHAGHASDINIKDVKLPDTTDHSSKLIDEGFERELLWNDLHLYNSSRSLADESIEENLNTSFAEKYIQIQANEKIYNLFLTKKIKIGKHRDCDLVTRLSEDGKQTASINKKISRFHCTLEILDGDKAVIYDGAEDAETIYNASSHGSYLDGIRIDSRNGGVLTGSHRLLLGGNYDGDVHTYSCEISKTHFVSQYFNQKNLRSSVVIESDDSLAAISKELISFKAINYSLPNAEIFCDQDECYITYDNEKEILKKGYSFSIDGVNITINEVRERGLNEQVR